jgi:hypothetical protein
MCRMLFPCEQSTVNDAHNVFLGLDSDWHGTLPFLLGPAPLLPSRTLLHMDNTLTTFSGLDLVGAVAYGRSTPLP